MESIEPISEAEANYLFSIARKAISYYFETEDKYFYPTDVPEKFREKMGVFVTLRIKGELRGCIGYPLPIKSIAESVADNAINSAFFDPRFPPLSKDELEKVEIEITLLTVPKPLEFRNPEELMKKIKIGRDGLIIEYGPYTGLLLPQVPVEEGWDVETYLSHLCLKAGLPSDAWRTKPVRIKTFQGIVLEEKKGNK